MFRYKRKDVFAELCEGLEKELCEFYGRKIKRQDILILLNLDYYNALDFYIPATDKEINIMEMTWFGVKVELTKLDKEIPFVVTLKKEIR